MLQWLDGRRGRLIIEDITAPRFDARRYGLRRTAVMTSIHAVLPDGRALKSMDAVRIAFGAVGLGWMLAPTRWLILRWIADATYWLFSHYRYQLLGRTTNCDPAAL